MTIAPPIRPRDSLEAVQDDVAEAIGRINATPGEVLDTVAKRCGRAVPFPNHHWS